MSYKKFIKEKYSVEKQGLIRSHAIKMMRAVSGFVPATDISYDKCLGVVIEMLNEPERICTKCYKGTLAPCEIEGKLVMGCDECNYYEEINK